VLKPICFLIKKYKENGRLIKHTCGTGSRGQDQLGYVSPKQFEKSWHAAQPLKASQINGEEVRPTGEISV